MKGIWNSFKSLFENSKLDIPSNVDLLNNISTTYHDVTTSTTKDNTHINNPQNSLCKNITTFDELMTQKSDSTILPKITKFGQRVTQYFKETIDNKILAAPDNRINKYLNKKNTCNMNQEESEILPNDTKFKGGSSRKRQMISSNTECGNQQTQLKPSSLYYEQHILNVLRNSSMNPDVSVGTNSIDDVRPLLEKATHLEKLLYSPTNFVVVNKSDLYNFGKKRPRCSYGLPSAYVALYNDMLNDSDKHKDSPVSFETLRRLQKRYKLKDTSRCHSPVLMYTSNMHSCCKHNKVGKVKNKKKKDHHHHHHHKSHCCYKDKKKTTSQCCKCNPLKTRKNYDIKNSDPSNNKISSNNQSLSKLKLVDFSIQAGDSMIESPTKDNVHKFSNKVLNTNQSNINLPLNNAGNHSLSKTNTSSVDKETDLSKLNLVNYNVDGLTSTNSGLSTQLENKSNLKTNNDNLHGDMSFLPCIQPKSPILTTSTSTNHDNPSKILDTNSNNNNINNSSNSLSNIAINTVKDNCSISAVNVDSSLSNAPVAHTSKFTNNCGNQMSSFSINIETSLPKNINSNNSNFNNPFEKKSPDINDNKNTNNHTVIPFNYQSSSLSTVDDKNKDRLAEVDQNNSKTTVVSLDNAVRQHNLINNDKNSASLSNDSTKSNENVVDTNQISQSTNMPISNENHTDTANQLIANVENDSTNKVCVPSESNKNNFELSAKLGNQISYNSLNPTITSGSTSSFVALQSNNSESVSLENKLFGSSTLSGNNFPQVLTNINEKSNNNTSCPSSLEPKSNDMASGTFNNTPSINSNFGTNSIGFESLSNENNFNFKTPDFSSFGKGHNINTFGQSSVGFINPLSTISGFKFSSDNNNTNSSGFNFTTSLNTQSSQIEFNNGQQNTGLSTLNTFQLNSQNNNPQCLNKPFTFQPLDTNSGMNFNFSSSQPTFSNPSNNILSSRPNSANNASNFTFSNTTATPNFTSSSESSDTPAMAFMRKRALRQKRNR